MQISLFNSSDLPLGNGLPTSLADNDDLTFLNLYKNPSGNSYVISENEKMARTEFLSEIFIEFLSVWAGGTNFGNQVCGIAISKDKFKIYLLKNV